jgi:hypothetical protein
VEKDAAIEAAIEEAVADAEAEDWVKRKQKEETRRAALSPRRKQLQSAVDAIDKKLTDWDDALNLRDRAKGHDQKALWAAIDGFAAVYRGAGQETDKTRWFVSWVKNRLIAEINTID